MTTELLAIAASLAAAVAGGSGDFGGGLASRRLDSLRVVVLAQIIGTAGLVAFALFSGDPLPPSPAAALAAVAGLGGGLGLLMLYQALAIGPMGVVAPLTAAVSGMLPVVVGILLEGWPGAWQMGGFLLALGAVWIIAGPSSRNAIQLRALALALASGVGFAVFLTVMARLAPYGVYWPLVIARAASIMLLVSILLARRGPRASGPLPWGLIAVAGLGDTAGNVLFVIATTLGRLDAAAVISSLYPAATVLLARAFLDERLTPRQLVGVVLALLAIVLIAL
jgi:drug/metabolite transporter (DMT)-like permease